MENQNFENPSHDQVKIILDNAKSIAIVGISANEEKDSYSVAKYLKNSGFKIYPVNPNYEKVLGEKCYPNLTSIPDHIDIVDIFRKPEAVDEIINEAIKIKAETIWMQLTVINEPAAIKAQKAGLKVIMDKCIKVEHNLLFL